MRELVGKVAVVTGAASGIGFALAERFLREGMKVVLADIEASALEDAQHKLGKNTLALQTDVSQAASVEQLAAKTLAAFGAVHIVCNNAGVGNPPAPVWESTLADWQWVLGVNLWGVIHGIRVFTPILLKQGGPGHIVNTASMAGLLSAPMMGIYNATKHAVVAISETMHAELAAMQSPLKVSVLCPAFVQTRIGESSRNRPAALAGAAIDEAKVAQFMAMMRAGLEGGLAPHVVADRVLEAIQQEKLYVLTHPEYKPVIQQHMEDIVADRL